MSIWQEFRDRITDRDYLRWRRKRLLIRFLLIILSMILLSPIIAVYKIFDIRGTFGFVFMAVCVLSLLAIYRALGWIGRPYIPPRQ